MGIKGTFMVASGLRLCLCTGRTDGRSLAETVEETLEGGATMVQVREKTASSKAFYEAALELRAITRKRGVPLIVNDRLDIALAAQADGVHLGQSDLPCKEARRLAPYLIIGVSASNADEARQAELDGADYIGAGAVFDTPSKADAGSPIGPDGLRAICGAVSIPVIAIGGITAENAPLAIGAGASGVAVISAILGAPSPMDAARQLRLAVDAVLPELAAPKGSIETLATETAGRKVKDILLRTGENDSGRRLSRILRIACPSLPLSAIHRLLRLGRVRLDGAKATGSTLVAGGQIITIRAKSLRKEGLEKGSLEDLRLLAHRSMGGGGDGSGGSLGADVPTDVPVEVLFDGDGILAVNKRAGEDTQDGLTPRVRAFLEGRVSPSLAFLPSPLHRLDKDTSGVVVFGASMDGARKFHAMMREHLLEKRYLAVLTGVLKGEQTWKDSLLYSGSERLSQAVGPGEERAQTAVSHVTAIESSGGNTLVSIEIKTGRRHQIRAQAAARGFPLLGDAKYGGGEGGYLLHARRIGFKQNTAFSTQNFPRSINAPLPAAFRARLAELGFTTQRL
jgi:thiamine-phosphate pyrophosphorylase